MFVRRATSYEEKEAVRRAFVSFDVFMSGARNYWERCFVYLMAP